MEAVRARLRLLYHFSDLMYSSWRLLNLSPNYQVRRNLLEPRDPALVLSLFSLTAYPCSAELHLPLQRRDLGNRPGPAEAPVGPPGLHPAHGPLHR